jgi:hypothetical protein
LNRARRSERFADAAWTKVRVEQLREQFGSPRFEPSLPTPKVVSWDEAARTLPGID